MSRRSTRGARLGLASLTAVAVLVAAADLRSQPPETFDPSAAPLDVARVMAARYPAVAAMSYIPALAWSGAFRLSRITGEPRWREKALAEMKPFLSGEKPVTPAPPAPNSLASLGAHAAFADRARFDRDPDAARIATAGADLIRPPGGEDVVRFGSGWTDDMYMATAPLVRVALLARDDAYGRVASRMLATYAEKLQRPDGLFIHAANGPHAWGRGNGFASLGLAEALEYLPADAADRPRLLAIFRRHVSALLGFQSADGSWRQVIDDPASYQELTATALFVSTLARGVRLGWLDATVVRPAIDRGWAGIVARVGKDGTLRDVCSSTGAGPTKEHYLTRPITNGADDRGGAMVLLAALELHELRRK
jgi:hypothetical protein